MNSTPARESKLKQADPDVEARLIYRALFGGTIPDILARRYAQAARRLDQDAEASDLAAVARLVDAGADLEAAELAGRLTGRLPLLTRKFTAMTYLAETLPDHQRYFVARRSSLVAGTAVLAWSGLLTAVKLARGLWLLRSVPRG
ncbi:MAG: hypothetical protein R2844_22760 [Caldilineales bacterium]